MKSVSGATNYFAFKLCLNARQMILQQNMTLKYSNNDYTMKILLVSVNC